MHWSEKIANIVTGKSKDQRMRDKLAYRQIREKQRVAYLKASEEEAVKVAETKAKLESEARIRKIKARYAPRPVGPTTSRGYSMPIGGPNLLGTLGGFGLAGKSSKKSSRKSRDYRVI